MDRKQIDHLENYCKIRSISSDERELRNQLEVDFEKFGEEVLVDRLGSIFKVKKSKNQNAKVCMIAFPMDEVGMMISGIEEDGRCRFVLLEALSSIFYAYQEVIIKTRDNKKIKGVVVHRNASTIEGLPHEMKLDDAVIDCGLPLEEVETNIKLGDLVLFQGEFKQLSKNIIQGGSLDQKAFISIAIELMERLKDVSLDYDLAIGGVAQSTIGFRGTKTATYVVQPDLALALTAFEMNGTNLNIHNNYGVVMSCYDKQMIPNQKLREEFKWCNPMVHPIITQNGNDGSFIHKTLRGTPTLSLGVGMKYCRTNRVMVNHEHLTQLVDACEKFLKGLTSEKITSLGFGVDLNE